MTENYKNKNEEKEREAVRSAPVKAMGSSYRTACSRQREARSLQVSETKYRNM